MEDRSDSGFREFFLAEYPVILSLMRVVLGDRQSAEDAVQEAFTVLFIHWKKVSRYEKPGAWVRKVALQEAGRTLRRRKRSALLHVESGRAGGQAPPDIHGSLMALSTAQRAAIVMHYLEDRPIAEIAEIMRCSPSTVKVHLHRGRNRLAEILGEVEPDAAR